MQNSAFAYQAPTFALLHDTSKNIVVMAPTGAGKTTVGFEALRQVGKGIYVCPSRTLCYEKWRELREEFPEKRIEIANQHYPMSRRQFREVDIRVMTPFKLLDFLNNVDDFEAQAPVVVLDEIDSMDFSIEVIYGLLRTLSPGSRIVALSGTIADADLPLLQGWLGGSSHCEVVRSDVRPKELLYHTVKVNPVYPGELDTSAKFKLQLSGVGDLCVIPAGKAQEPTVAAVLGVYAEIRKLNEEPILVWSPRRYHAGSILKALVKDLPKQSGWSRKDDAYQKMLAESLENLPEAKTWSSRMLREALPLGIGLHHGGISMEEQHLVNDLSKRGELDVVVGCLSMDRGKHHPFGHVVISTVRDPKTEVASPLMDISRFHQVSGRAGRVGFDSEQDGHVWVVCQSEIDAVEVEMTLRANRATGIQTEIDNKRTLTILLASLILGDRGQRFRRREKLLEFVSNLPSAARMAEGEAEDLLDAALADFVRYGMIEEKPFGYWLTRGGEAAARLGVHPQELLAIEALCENREEAVFSDWVEVLSELYPSLVDSEAEVSEALKEVTEYGLAVYSESGVSTNARPLADYVQRLLDRTQAYFAYKRYSSEEIEIWRREVYLRFILGEFKTAWALSEAGLNNGTLRRLVRSLGKVLKLVPQALDDSELLQIAQCLYRQSQRPSARELKNVASALQLDVERWRRIVRTASAEEV